MHIRTLMKTLQMCAVKTLVHSLGASIDDFNPITVPFLQGE